MFVLNLKKAKEGEERIDIYYAKMTPAVKQIISIVQKERPVLYGMAEEEKVLLETEDIYYFDTVDRRTFAYTADTTCQVAKTLSLLEEELKPFGFIRINKSNLVNIYKIKRIKPEPNMRISAILKNGERLQINRGYKRTFEEYLQEIRKSV